MNKEIYLKIIGSIFLFYLGVKTFLKQPANNAANLKGETLFSMYISTFILMITNPTTILYFVAMFSGLGINQETVSSPTVLALISGVFFGCFILVDPIKLRCKLF